MNLESNLMDGRHQQKQMIHPYLRRVISSVRFREAIFLENEHIHVSGVVLAPNEKRNEKEGHDYS